MRIGSNFECISEMTQLSLQKGGDLMGSTYVKLSKSKADDDPKQAQVQSL